MNKTFILVCLFISCLLLSGCSGSQLDWFGASLEVWFNVNGFATQEGLDVDLDELVGFLIDQAVDDFTNSEEANALDAARNTLADIEEADKYLESAFTSSTISELSEKSIYEIEKAQELRPDDITYQEAEVAIWMVNGNNAAVQSAISDSDRIVLDFIKQGGDCQAAILNQLRTRKKMLVRQLDNISIANDIVTKDNINQMIGELDGEINSIVSGKKSGFCQELGR